MRVIFAGTPEFAVAPLSALLRDHQVIAVFTQPDRRAGRGKKLSIPPVKELAIEHNIPVYQPSQLSDQASLIQQLSPDVLVVVAYGMLIPQAILDIPKFGGINIHASILPRWRGAAPIQRAIQAGDAETGVSIMQMESGLDTGPVFEVFTVAIDDTDTSATLHNKLSSLGAKGICSTLAKLDSCSQPKQTKQNDAVATYARKISKSEANIDWSLSALAIDAQIRAFNPWPICQSFHCDNKIRIWQAKPVTEADLNDFAPEANQVDSHRVGRIVHIDNQGVTVACGQGLLRLEVMQRDGSKALDASLFCNGYSFKVGQHFDQQ